MVQLNIKSMLHRKINIAQLVFVLLILNIMTCMYYLISVHVFGMSHATLRTAFQLGGGSKLGSVLTKVRDNDRALIGGELTKHRQLDRLVLRAVNGSKDAQNVLGNINVLDPGNDVRLLPNEIDVKDFINVARFVYVYSAYFDNREGRDIRLVAIALTVGHGVVQCVLRDAFKDVDVIVDAKFHKSLEDHALPFSAHLLSCPIPDRVSTESVYTHGVTIKGSFGNIPPILTQFNLTKIPPRLQDHTFEHTFGICVPPLFGKGIKPVNIVEFVEVSQLLGAGHITFYDYSVDAKTREILRAYEDMGVVTVKPWRHGFKSKQVWYFGQAAMIWDCMYHNMYKTRYIAHNDLDEFLVPRNSDNWTAMIHDINYKRYKTHNIAGYQFSSVTFDNSYAMQRSVHYPEIKQLKTLHTVIRDRVASPSRSKLMVDPRKTFEVGVHRLIKGIDYKKRVVIIDEETAMVHHYRRFEWLTDNPPLFVDNYMWKFQQEIITAMNRSLKWLRTKDIEIKLNTNYRCFDCGWEDLYYL